MTIFLYSVLLNLLTEVCLWCWPWTFRVFHLSFCTNELVWMYDLKWTNQCLLWTFFFFLDFIFLKPRLKLRYCTTSIYLLEREGRESLAGEGERKRVRDRTFWTPKSVYARREFNWLLDHSVSEPLLSSCNPSFLSSQSPDFLFLFFFLLLLFMLV